MEIRPTLLISTYNNPRVLAACLRSVMRQRKMPWEVVVADDGSAPDTRALVDAFRCHFPVPIRYVWQEDRGFRLSMVRNKAIAAATGNYIIQINGDVVLGRNFISDHLQVARPGTFICGARVSVNRKATRIMFKRNRKYVPTRARIFRPNALRIPGLFPWMSENYQPSRSVRIQGGNMSFWREDLLRVNAYNEDLALFGDEESELASRLIHAGVAQRYIRFGAIEYHLDHPFRVRRSRERILQRQPDYSHTLVRCLNGIDKYFRIPQGGYAEGYVPAFERIAGL